MKRLIKAFSFVALAMSLGCSSMWAQNTNSGDIRGTATDATGAVIPDVKVTILDIEKGVTKELMTNAAGLYDSGPIVTGTYKITFTKDGFS